MTTSSKTTTRRTTSTRKTTSTAKPKTTRASTKKVTEADKVLAETIADAVETDDLIVAQTNDTDEAETDMAEHTVPDEMAILDQPELKKRDLIEMAVERSGVKKRDAKPAIEAVLAILGEALAEGRELNLQPMGKLKVTRMKKSDNVQIINARVRQPQHETSTEISETDPLAHAAE